MDLITMESRSLSGTLSKWESQKRTRNCLLLYDVYTGSLQSFDIPRHNTDEVERCIRRFAGKKFGTVINEIRYMYTDGAPEFVEACNRCGIDTT